MFVFLVFLSLRKAFEDDRLSRLSIPAPVAEWRFRLALGRLPLPASGRRPAKSRSAASGAPFLFRLRRLGARAATAQGGWRAALEEWAPGPSGRRRFPVDPVGLNPFRPFVRAAPTCVSAGLSTRSAGSQSRSAGSGSGVLVSGAEGRGGGDRGAGDTRTRRRRIPLQRIECTRP